MSRFRAAAAISWLVLWGTVTGTDAAVVRIPASGDNTLFAPVADTLSSNGAGPYLFAGRNGQGNIRRALLVFPVADSLPAGAVIDSVELRFTVSQVSNAVPRALGIHRLLASWGEGASSAGGGGGAAPAPGDATWVHRFFPDVAWTTAGGDVAGQPSATSVGGIAGPYVVVGAGLTADVSGWLAAPGTNFGWAILGDELIDNSARRINSRENPTTGTRPELVVTWRLPEPVHESTWSRIKRLASP